METDYEAYDIDVSRPTGARVYDYFLGGDHNYEVDQVFAQQLLEICPFIRDLALQNRAFLGRGVRFAVQDLGIRQFVDVGSGIPAPGNTHEVAQALAPDCRVLYADNDGEAVTTGRQVLEGRDDVAFIPGDFTRPETILDNEQTSRTIDFSEPVGLMVVALLHFVDDQADPARILRDYLDRLAPGSVLIASHAGVDATDEECRERLLEVERRYGNTANPVTMRTRRRFGELFDGLELVEPGLTHCAHWRATTPVAPDDAVARCLHAAVARKP